MATDPAYISVREAARLLGVHDNTVRRYADRGMLRVARLPSGEGITGLCLLTPA
jgi:excisionase family DNA binding protein